MANRCEHVYIKTFVDLHLEPTRFCNVYAHTKQLERDITKSEQEARVTVSDISEQQVQ